MSEKPFIAGVYRQKKCESCTADQAGFYERIDCGCVFSVIVGRYATAASARMAAMGAARAKGRGRFNGICTGHWDVEGPVGLIEAGEIAR